MNKYVLITGASGTIGTEIARTLAKEGYHLYLHYHQNQAAMARLMEELRPLGGEYIPIQADLSLEDGFKLLARQIFSLDAIIHNSGQSQYGLLTDLQEQELDALLHLHVRTPLLLTGQLLPKLTAKQHGRIIVVSSIWGQTGAACEVAYSTVKGAQIAFVKALSKETARAGITVNAVAPGAVESAMMASFDQDELEQIKEEIPSGRLGHPEEIASAVAFLMNQKAAYITGQTIAVNGGWYT